MESLLLVSDIQKKLELLEGECHGLLTHPSAQPSLVPHHPGRDLEVRTHSQLPERKGLQSAEGQARLLHDLANIELQAMELGLRTLYEFPTAPQELREQLVHITLDEGRHLRMCLDGISSLGFSWGHWPAHISLWEATSANDSLLERIFIVHCYLEGSGLDSGEALLQKLSGVINKMPRDIVKVIAAEEEDHVRFGLNWLKKLSENEPNVFPRLLNQLRKRLPPRAARVAPTPRLRVGFDESSLQALLGPNTNAPSN